MDNGGYNLIWVGDDYDMITNPKGLISMNKDKALGSIKWTKKILGNDKKCFIYDPSKESIFNDNGSMNIKKIK